MRPSPDPDTRLSSFRDASMEFDSVYGLLARSCGLSGTEYWALVLIREGVVTQRAILQIPAHYPGVRVDHYVVMPNHVHMILVLPEDGGRALRAPTLSRIIRAWKETVTKTLGRPIWQRSFYDHIIRDENDYRQIWNYIDTNPAKWAGDRYYIDIARES